MTTHFSAELEQKIRSLVGRFETTRSSILPVLHAIQDDHDWISDEDIAALEKEFNLSAVDVREVMTFYTMYRKSPPKPYRIEICNSISCWLLGSEKTLEAIRARLSEAEAQGRSLPFECHQAECLGVCGYAPVGLVNKDRYLSVTPEKALELIEQYSQQELPPAAKKCAELLRQSKAGA